MSCRDLRETLNAKDKIDCFDTSHVAKEKGKRFAFSNPAKKSICRVKIDNCLITGNQKKCDFLFKVLQPDRYYLVELKGVNINDGIEQILNTYKIVNIKIKAAPESYSGVIVSSNVPSSAHQRFRKLQEQCYRETKLLIKKTHMEHIEKI